MELMDVAYLAIVVLFSLRLIWRADHKLLLFMVLVWFLGYPILSQPEFFPRIPLLGFELQPDRLLLLVLLFIVLRNLLRVASRSYGANSKPFVQGQILVFERFMYVYVFVSALTIGLNSQGVNPQRILTLISGQVLFLLLYRLSRQSIDERGFVVLCQAVWGVAIFSGFVGIIQFFLDPAFFRIGVSRVAFGEFYRANGVFRAEYDQGIFQIIALLLALFIQPRPAWARLVWVLAPIAIVFTMHRLSWAVLVVIMGMAIALAFRRKPAIVLTVLFLTILVYVVIQVVPVQTLLPLAQVSDFWYTRVLEDTIGSRLAQYPFAALMVTRYPWGVGSYESTLYQQEAFLYGLPFLNGWALIVHNGFVASAVRHGILGAAAFWGFVIGALIYLGKRVLQDRISPLTLLMFAAYAGFNLTNDFSDLGVQMMIFLGFLFGATVTRMLREQGELQDELSDSAKPTARFRNPALGLS